jgi:hypothetical protein
MAKRGDIELPGPTNNGALHYFRGFVFVRTASRQDSEKIIDALNRKNILGREWIARGAWMFVRDAGILSGGGRAKAAVNRRIAA